MENISSLIILVLAGLLIFKDVYWSRQLQKLIDKVMSKNYAEYVQVNNTKEERPKIKVQEEPEDLRILQDFHRI